MLGKSANGPVKDGRSLGAGTAALAKGTPAPWLTRAKSGLLIAIAATVTLAMSFLILGRETPMEVGRPRWNPGQTVDIDLFLIRADRQELACASADEIAGKHCAFEAINKPWSKGDAADDKNVLKPYTTTDRVQLTAAGLWSDAALAPDKLPAGRFSAKCKYKVEGKLRNVAVRWEQTGQWYPNSEWYAGSVSECKIEQ